MSSWNSVVSTCDKDPIEGKELIHTHTQLLSFGLGGVEVGHFQCDLMWVHEEENVHWVGAALFDIFCSIRAVEYVFWNHR